MDMLKIKTRDCLSYLKNNYSDCEDTMDSILGLQEIIETLQTQLTKVKEENERLRCCGKCKRSMHNPNHPQSNELGITDFTVCEECIHNCDPDSVGREDNWESKK